MTWQPQVGEYCRTRDGRRAYVAAELQNPFTDLPIHRPLAGYIGGSPDPLAWNREGRNSPNMAGGESPNDLVGTWIEPVDVPVTVVLGPEGRHLVIDGCRTDFDGTDVLGYKHATIRVSPGDRGL